MAKQPFSELTLPVLAVMILLGFSMVAIGLVPIVQGDFGYTTIYRQLPFAPIPILFGLTLIVVVIRERIKNPPTKTKAFREKRHRNHAVDHRHSE